MLEWIDIEKRGIPTTITVDSVPSNRIRCCGDPIPISRMHKVVHLVGRCFDAARGDSASSYSLEYQQPVHSTRDPAQYPTQHPGAAISWVIVLVSRLLDRETGKASAVGRSLLRLVGPPVNDFAGPWRACLTRGKVSVRLSPTSKGMSVPSFGCLTCDG